VIDAIPESLWTVLSALAIAAGVILVWRAIARVIREDRATRAAVAEFNRNRCMRRWECAEHVCPRDCSRRIRVAQ
jgi:hypothetical protein